MIFHFLFSRYFVFTFLATTLLMLAHGNQPSMWSMSSIFISFSIVTIGIYGFLHNKKFSELHHIFIEATNFTYRMVVTLSLTSFLGFIIFSEYQYSEVTYDVLLLIIALFSTMILQAMSVDYTQFAIGNSKMTGRELTDLFLQKQNLIHMAAVALLVFALNFLINDFYILMLVSIYSFFHYFVPSKYFEQQNT